MRLTPDEFERVLVASGLSDKTVRSYVYTIRDFSQRFEDVSVVNLNSYLMQLKEKGNSPATIELRRTALRRYCDLSEIRINWKSVIVPKSRNKFSPKIFTQEEITKIISSIEDAGLRVLLKTAYECCCRAAEVCSLRCDDVDLERGVIMIHGLKGSRSSEIPISEDLVDELKEHIRRGSIRKKLPLFKSKWRRPYNPNYLSSVVFKAVVRRTLGDKRARETNFHGFARHSRITHLLQEGADIADVNYVARHQTVQMTSRYVHLQADDVAARLGNRLLPPWKKK